MTDNTELMIRNGAAVATALVTKFHFGKSWLIAGAAGAVAYVLMDWAYNLRAQ
jgi:hypothetical protein